MNNYPDSNINIWFIHFVSPSFLRTLLRIGIRHLESLALNTWA